MEHKEDRRTRKTKKALRESLAELLNEKSIQNITINELTQKADVHRSTFYANFSDIYDLCQHMEDTVIQEISAVVLAVSDDTPIEYFKGVFNYINDNRQLSRLFFGRNISTTFYDRLTDILISAYMNCIYQEHGDISVSEEMEHIAQFCLSGSLGVIGKWVSNGFKYPAEKLVMILADINSKFEQVL